MSDLIKISRGTVYDPANGIDGEVRDLWIAGGKIVAAPTDPAIRPTREIDARGLVVMPGGIDMHCHIAGPKVNVARKMRPEEKRKTQVLHRTANTHSGTLGSVPSTFATGYKYAGMGYTTAFDAAIPPLGARHAHEEFDDTPCIDKGFYVLMGNNHYVMQLDRTRRSRRKLKAFIAWLLGATKGYAPKLVNPGGVEVWKSRQGGNVHGLDDTVDHFDVTPRQIIRGVAQAAAELGLPHPVHIHCNNLGMPGNWTTTLETMQALEGHRAHLTHIQFHSYGGGDGDENTFNSKTLPLAEYVNAHPNLTVDVGQVMFGETTSMTGDGPLGYYLVEHLQRQVVQLRHRNGIRLRHRADQVPEQVARPLAAMGDRPRVVSAGRRSLARRDEHRPSQRRLVPGLSANHSAADGSHLPPRRAQKVSTRRFASARTLADLDREYTLNEIASSPAPARHEFSASNTKATWDRAPTPTSRSTRRTRTRKRCSSCRAS